MKAYTSLCSGNITVDTCVGIYHIERQWNMEKERSVFVVDCDSIYVDTFDTIGEAEDFIYNTAIDRLYLEIHQIIAWKKKKLRKS